MTFSLTPGEAKQEECYRLIKESLGQDYVQLKLVGELKIHENLENSQTKITCHVRARDEDFPIVGIGKGPVDALYSSLSKMLSQEYSSLTNFYFLEFGVRANLLKRSKISNPGSDAHVEAVLVLRNGDGNDFVFRARDCSVIGASMRAALSAIEYLINLEEAVIKMHVALEDAKDRKRDDLVAGFTNKLIQLVDRSSYKEAIRREREKNDK
tara:strand:+ start:166 stop:798 length:633 start_codon:yes stop_codon:yes gene_type:complete